MGMQAVKHWYNHEILKRNSFRGAVEAQRSCILIMSGGKPLESETDKNIEG
jgi:hypothetical protein